MAVQIEAVKNRNGQLRTLVGSQQEHIKTVQVKVTKETEGPVTVVQKIQGYYKAVAAFVAALLVVLNQITPLTGFLPEPARHWFTVTVVVVGAISTLLIKNRTWVDALSAG